LTFQVAAGAISGPFTLANGAVTESTDVSGQGQAGVTNGGHAVFNFTITNAGSYVIQMLVNAPSDSANSLWFNIDAQPQDPAMVFDVPLTSGFEQRIASWRGNGTTYADQFIPKTFNLTAGAHQLIIVGREANTQLQSVSILALPAPPKNLRIMAAR
jgi:hypothetical protein